jgi:hypothetical protein
VLIPQDFFHNFVDIRPDPATVTPVVDKKPASPLGGSPYILQKFPVHSLAKASKPIGKISDTPFPKLSVELGTYEIIQPHGCFS